MSIEMARNIAEGMTSPYEEDQTIIGNLVANFEGGIETAEDVDEQIRLAEALEDEAVDARLRGEAIWLNVHLRKPQG